MAASLAPFLGVRGDAETEGGDAADQGSTAAQAGAGAERCGGAARRRGRAVEPVLAVGAGEPQHPQTGANPLERLLKADRLRPFLDGGAEQGLGEHANLRGPAYYN